MKGAVALVVGGLLAWWLLRETDQVDATAELGEAEMPIPDATTPPYSRSRLEALAVECATMQGATPAVLLAHCDIETFNWDHRAANMTGGDMKRGGAYGCPQITLRTARTLDDRIGTFWRDVDPARGGRALLDFPELAFTLAAAAVAENEGRVRADGGRLADVAALYNSGKTFAAAPERTKGYVEKFLAAYQRRTGSREWG